MLRLAIKVRKRGMNEWEGAPDLPIFDLAPSTLFVNKNVSLCFFLGRSTMTCRCSLSGQQSRRCQAGSFYPPWAVCFAISPPPCRFKNFDTATVHLCFSYILAAKKQNTQHIHSTAWTFFSKECRDIKTFRNMIFTGNSATHAATHSHKWLFSTRLLYQHHLSLSTFDMRKQAWPS